MVPMTGRSSVLTTAIKSSKILASNLSAFKLEYFESEVMKVLSEHCIFSPTEQYSSMHLFFLQTKGGAFFVINLLCLPLE